MRERDNRRRRDRDDSRDRRERRERNRSRDRDRGAGSSGKGSGSAPPPAATPMLTEKDFEGKSQEEIEMMKIMGFGGFNTTKNKESNSISGNIRSYNLFTESGGQCPR